MPHSNAARRTHRRTLRIAVTGLTVGTALTLTACGIPDDADALQTRRAKPVAPMAWEAKASAAEGGIGGHGTGGGSWESRARHAACDAAQLRIEAKPLSRPANHLLLEATNTSGSSCDLYGAPYPRFDDAQSPLAPLPSSKPRAVVTLTPGSSGYAAVRTSSADDAVGHGRTVTALSVGLAVRDGKDRAGDATEVALPGGAVYLGTDAWVTYWQPDPGDAAAWWVTSR
ncbi:DUF4232 domain-containing protein [Streptomyces chattanoogensis]|uniref:DUF4232 domain-containing protein n=1 Tax=Streptomyces chattanoogensis TaxID=66876 RepID=A0A0N0XUA4_9ACTN|nr:DUF4232 domain-containing protein [Streptomyces chattanoogensis]KPC61908.1 hypothetical protein ADL29_21925 [Streptomyces chattanoogensis]